PRTGARTTGRRELRQVSASLGELLILSWREAHHPLLDANRVAEAPSSGHDIRSDRRAPAGAAQGRAPRYSGAVDTLLRLTSGAPAAALLLATMLVVGLLGLYRAPQLIERNLLRPCGLAQRR